MLHPLLLSTVAFNVSVTVVYWIVLLNDLYDKWKSEPEDMPKKPTVAPAEGVWTDWNIVNQGDPTCSFETDLVISSGEGLEPDWLKLMDWSWICKGTRRTTFLQVMHVILPSIYYDEKSWNVIYCLWKGLQCLLIWPSAIYKWQELQFVGQSKMFDKTP